MRARWARGRSSTETTWSPTFLLVAERGPFWTPTERLFGKWKASQNRSNADRVGVAEGPRARGDASSAKLAARHTEG